MGKNWLNPFIEASPLNSQEELADLLNLSRATINRLANDHSKLKMDRAIELAKVLGTSPEDLMLNKPPGSEPSKKSIVGSFDPDQPDSDVSDDWDGNGGALVDGEITFNRTISGSSPEFSARPGLGPGQIDDRSARIVSNGIATGHPVVNEWLIPPGYVRNALDAAPSQIIVLPVIGHSMEPVLRSNDRILVDVSQNAWMGDAVYVIDDGDGVLQAKTLKKVTSSHPPAYRIISEASPDEDPIVRGYDEFRIVGRVVGRFTRM